MRIRVKERSICGYFINGPYNKYSANSHNSYIILDLNCVPNISALINVRMLLTRRIVYIMRGLGNEKLHNM